MTTQAIEFTTMTHDGVIDLPKKMSNLSQQVRVILLLNNAPKVEYCTRHKFPDLTEFRNQLPPAKTSAVELICHLRDEENARY
jgi:hypothetical protein